MNCKECGISLSAWYYYRNSYGEYCSQSCADKYAEYREEMQPWRSFVSDYKREGDED